MHLADLAFLRRQRNDSTPSSLKIGKLIMYHFKGGFFMFLSQAPDLKSYFYFIHPSFSSSSSSVGNVIVYIMMPQVRLRLYDGSICYIQIYIMYSIGNLSGFIWCS